MRQSFKCCLIKVLACIHQYNCKFKGSTSREYRVFSCKNSQFEFPPNFISQIDRGSIALSLEYCLSNESHVSHACTRKGFSPFKNRKIDGRDNTDLEGNFEKILKNQIEIF